MHNTIERLSFSIIIPTYNSSSYIKNCIKSLIEQNYYNYKIELIFVDDCSLDNTVDIIKKELEGHKINSKILSTQNNSGPGIARNLGIKAATYDWILFLDSDDLLVKNIFEQIEMYIQKTSTKLDIIGFNWTYKENVLDKKSLNNKQRYDMPSLQKEKKELIKDYLSLWMDNSVIFTLIRRELIIKNNIFFRNGIHEDVDFIFKIYLYASTIGVLDIPLYIKDNRINSIINSFNEQHIDGFCIAFDEIYKTMEDRNMWNNEYLESFYKGTLGVIYTLLRRVYYLNAQDDKKNILLISLYNKWLSFQKYFKTLPKQEFNSKYFIIINKFAQIMKNNCFDNIHNINLLMENYNNQSWSCYDLHNSLFLAPNEIRACCKRFFINNEIKGDVVLLNGKEDKISVENILNKKRDLYNNINKGISSECNQCPFLEFKNWGTIDKLKIEYISFEYHSKCNMKCTYCSEKYYGGEEVSYDIYSFINDLHNINSFENCKHVIWGGGEPTLDKNFNNIFKIFFDNLKNAKQKVITNATIYNNILHKAVNKDKALILTSIDAGNKSNFKLIRKSNKYTNVFSNLIKYSNEKPENIIIKYILLENNKSYDELYSFVEEIYKNNLQKCNFQISFDFKLEVMDYHTVRSAVLLYALLYVKNARMIFFDDLLYRRIKDVMYNNYSQLEKFLKKYKLEDALASPKNFKRIIIWGAGDKTKYLLETSIFFKHVRVEYIIDESNEKIGEELLGYKIYTPSKLSETNLPIFISSYIHSSYILTKYENLGLNKSRLIKKLII